MNFGSPTPGPDPNPLPMVSLDRRCRPAALQNPLRRWLAPPSRVLDPLGVTGDVTVADLGAGVGYFAPETLRRMGRGGRLYLVDPDTGNLAIAGSRVRDDPRVILLAASAAGVPQIRDESVDRALLSLVICCLVDKEGAMDETWRVLKPGGRVYVSYPTRALPRWPRGTSLRVTPQRWSALMTRHPWRVLSERSGWFVTEHFLERP
jgi:SAM-dependent methyltransferase